MKKTILITGATDGIGLEMAKSLASQGHTLLVHGRNSQKLSSVQTELSAITGAAKIETYQADFSVMAEVEVLAAKILETHNRIDILFNNAGVYKTSTPRTTEGYDLRFAVNTFAPYILTERLLPIIPKSGRVINLSSAAQAPVDLSALIGETEIGDMPAYAQSKLAITMWTKYMAEAHVEGPMFFAVNPGSLLNTKMVKEGWGTSNNDIEVGVDILVRAAFSEDFIGHSGDYFDNDKGSFTPPHVDGLDDHKIAEVVATIKTILNPL